MNNKKIILPRLPFGNDIANINHDIKLFSSNMSKVVTSLDYYEKDSDEFLCKTSILEFNGFKAIASANTPTKINVLDSNDITLLIPFSGRNISVVEKTKFEWGDNCAILLPKTVRAGGSGTRATLSIDINPIKINNYAKLMLGLDSDEFVNLRLDEPRIMPLIYRDFSILDSIRQICKLVDIYQNNQNLYSAFAIDELFYRQIIMMLIPERFLDNKYLSSKCLNNHQLSQLIEYAKDNPKEFSTLFDIERFTKLSARTLQYEFKKHLNMTPSQWLRKIKLEYAYNTIMNSNNSINITTIAILSGFSNFSLFSKYYREYFGETPSDSLKKAKKI